MANKCQDCPRYTCCPCPACDSFKIKNGCNGLCVPYSQRFDERERMDKAEALLVTDSPESKPV